MSTGSMGASLRFGQVESSIFGESALVDRETGRVYWECGNSNTLYESVIPKLDQFGLDHAQATFLTVLITLAFLSVVSGWLKRAIDSSFYNTASSSPSPKIMAVAVLLAEHTILKLPKIENKWLVSAIVVLYFFESFHCSTRCSLANAMLSETELDTYIDRLKREPPVVTWKVQTFHYELCRLLALPLTIRSFLVNLKKQKQPVTPTPTAALESEDTANEAPHPQPNPTNTGGSESPIRSYGHTAPVPLLTRKVITNEASATYRYSGYCDKSTTGVWSRPHLSDDARVPFRKISISKVLVLSNKRSREDYFKQQSEFVMRYGREDEFAEFSTSIQVDGYRPRLLIVRAPSGENHRKHASHKLARLSVFWAFTCLGWTVPYRVWFKRHCDFLRVTLVKETTSDESVSNSYLRSWFPSRASLRFTNKNIS